WWRGEPAGIRVPRPAGAIGALAYSRTSPGSYSASRGRRQMVTEELPRLVEHAIALDARGLGAALWMLADVHAKRAGGLVEVSPIEEGVRQAVDESKRDVGARSLQRFIEQHALAMRH